MPLNTRLPSDHTTLLSHAVSPNLFAATRFPELLISLLLANLLSPSLHDLVRYLNPHEHGGEMQTLHNLLHKRFFHPTHREFGAIWGLQEREGLHDPADRVSCDYAMGIIRRNFTGTLTEYPWLQVMIAMLDQGLFPRYSYPLIEMIRAQRHLVPGQGKKVLGITSCLDECLLIAALALAAGYCRLDDLVLAGSPFHYTLFVLPEKGDGGWFNAKRELLHADRFHGLSPQQAGELFNNTVYLCDRIITPRGHCLLNSREARISHTAMQQIADKIGCFMGVVPQQVSDALEITKKRDNNGYVGSEPLYQLGCYEPAYLEPALLAAAQSGGIMAEAALYSFRHPLVPDPEPYRLASLKGFRSFIWAGEVFSVADAIAKAGALKGKVSLLGEDLNRCALPDEVLAFDTASPSERALLVYTLVQHALQIDAGEKEALQILWEQGRWILYYNGVAIDLNG